MAEQSSFLVLHYCGIWTGRPIEDAHGRARQADLLKSDIRRRLP